MNNKIRKIVRKDSAFFFWGVSSLPKAQREAMYTLYAFFRHIDAIDGGDMNIKEKDELVKAWREEFDNIYEKKVPATDIGRKIYKNCMRFNLPKSEFLKLIDSLAMDIPEPLQAPKLPIFAKYCRGRAGSPCNLSLRVLGCNDDKLIEDLSIELGSALEITTILRDIKEDTASGHLYIPKEILEEADIVSTDPTKVVINKNLVTARENLAQIAEKNFQNAYNLIEKLDKDTAKSINSLANLYKRYLDIMSQRGWEIISPKPKIGKVSRMFIMLKSLRGKKV